MTETSRRTLLAFLQEFFQNPKATLEQTTTANVGGFAVPLGGLIRRATPTTVATIVPESPLPSSRRRFRRR